MSDITRAELDAALQIALTGQREHFGELLSTHVDALGQRLEDHTKDLGRRIDEVRDTVKAQNSRIGKAETERAQIVTRLGRIEQDVQGHPMRRSGDNNPPQMEGSIDLSVPVSAVKQAITWAKKAIPWMIIAAGAGAGEWLGHMKRWWK